jgi:hypothetical protein
VISFCKILFTATRQVFFQVSSCSYQIKSYQQKSKKWCDIWFAY